MTRTVWLLIAIALCSSSIVIGQRSRPADVELQKAIRTETIDGNVQGANRLYDALVKTYARTAPDVAARALLGLGKTYQALGDSRARPTLERVAAEYPSQREVVALAAQALGRAKTLAQARVWSGSGRRTILSVSPDGRLAAYSGPDGFSLRRLGSDKDEASFPESDAPAFSADSRQIAFNHWGKKQFEIARIDGTGTRVVRVNPPDVRYYNPSAADRRRPAHPRGGSAPGLGQGDRLALGENRRRHRPGGCWFPSRAEPARASEPFA